MDIVRAKEMLSKGWPLLNEYYFLINTSGMDFFTGNIWNQLPRSWQLYFDNANLEQLATFLNFNSEILQADFPEFPETLLNLRKSIINNSLPRKKTDNFNETNPYPTTSSNLVLSKMLDLPLYNEFCKTNGLFVNKFFRGVKLKKRHEIQLLSKMVYKSITETNVEFVVDVGAGLGHLSRTLSYIYGIDVVAIEQDTFLSGKANDLDVQIEKTISFLYPEYKGIPKSLVHYTYQIKDSTDVDDFIYILRHAVSDNKQNFTFGIVGLHPCGNLAATLLKVYKDCKQCRFINLASCCYMKLTSSEEASDLGITAFGFPLSETADETNIKISRTARDLACHAIETYMEQLVTSNLEVFKVHCYRAVLEVLISKQCSGHEHMQLQNVKLKSNLTFAEFCRLSLKGRGTVLNEGDFKNDNIQKMLSQWKRVVSFHCLRLIFAPLIETIILLDRYLYLHQSKDMKYVQVKPCFDPRISPRTHVLSSIKLEE